MKQISLRVPRPRTGARRPLRRAEEDSARSTLAGAYASTSLGRHTPRGSRLGPSAREPRLPRSPGPCAARVPAEPDPFRGFHPVQQHSDRALKRQVWKPDRGEWHARCPERAGLEPGRWQFCRVCPATHGAGRAGDVSRRRFAEQFRTVARARRRARCPSGVRECSAGAAWETVSTRAERFLEPRLGNNFGRQTRGAAPPSGWSVRKCFAKRLSRNTVD